MDIRKLLRIGTSSLMLNLLPNISNAGLVKVNNRTYDVKDNYSVFLNNQQVIDRNTIKKAIATELLTKEIKENRITVFGFRLLGLLGKGQELTMKHSSQIEAGLTFPIKLLMYAVSGGDMTYDAIRDLTKKDLEATIKELENRPEKIIKDVAYNFYSKANKRYDENLTLIRRIRNGGVMSFEDTVKFMDNSEYIEVYAEPSQKLYHDAVNLRPLEKRWGEKLLEELTGDLIPKRQLDKIAYGIKDEYAPLKDFELEVQRNKEKVQRKKRERESRINSLANQAVFLPDSVSERKAIEELFREQENAVRTRNINTYLLNLDKNSPNYYKMKMAAEKVFACPETILSNTIITNIYIVGDYATVSAIDQILVDRRVIDANSKYYLTKREGKWKFSSSESDKTFQVCK
ncbi:MAG: hypothetical protein AB1571_01000 [Nanoarchaeota archaeon]